MHTNTSFKKKVKEWERREARRQRGRGKTKGKSKTINFLLKLGCANLSTKAIYTHPWLKGGKGEGGREQKRKSRIYPSSPFLELPTTTKMTATFNKSPAQPITFQKALLLSPLHARKSDVPSLHKCFPTCKIKRKLHTLSVSSAEVENLVPRHFILNVETTQLIKRVHRVYLLACLF